MYPFGRNIAYILEAIPKILMGCKALFFALNFVTKARNISNMPALLFLVRTKNKAFRCQQIFFGWLLVAAVLTAAMGGCASAPKVVESPAPVTAQQADQVKIPVRRSPNGPASIAPGGQYEQGPSTKGNTDALPDDGQNVTLTGRLGDSVAGIYRIFNCEHAQAVAPNTIKILPNGYLQSMERIAEKAARSPLFDVDAEVTRYQDEVYILVTRAVVVDDSDEAAGETVR